jgi:glucans biosynthesis protein
MHGGSPGSGAPRRNKNALRHGRFTREAVAERKKIRELIGETRKLMMMIK